jgi:hypothetical protein
MKKIKSTKIILEKKQKIIKKTMWGNTLVIHSVLKKKNYKAKFSTSSILKKIKSTKTILKKKHKKLKEEEEEDNFGKNNEKKNM